MTELVFIGIGLDKGEITTGLDSCLLTDEEMQQDSAVFSDPLPAFV
ncbi:hypothetical protein CHH69_05685 [Terribacillus saccharophilus]|nr:hypothetical protein CHH69_05685 [Terribacillus saccharophilus]